MILGSSYAPEETGIAPYTTGLAEHFAAKGHHVTVVTGLPSYPHWQVYPEYRRVMWRREVRGGVDIRRMRSYVPRRQSASRRALYEATFLAAELTALALPQPDAILGVVPALSAGVAARIAARRFGSPYGLVFQDLTGPAAIQSGVSGGGLAAGVIKATEGWAAQAATAVGIIAEGFGPYLRSIGVDQNRIIRVRNWMHVGDPKLERMAVRRRLGLPQDTVICLHAGNMGLKQGLTNIIECARLAMEIDSRLLFVLMGDGSQRSHLVDLTQEYNLTNLQFLPIQPAEFFPSVLASADVLLVNQRASVTNMSLPGKLTSYFAAGRPVVAAVSPESETATEVVETGAGVLVTPDQPVHLLEAVRTLAADPVRQERLGAAGRTYARRALNAEQALHDLESLIERVVHSKLDCDRQPA
jgi:glycosyltransferase involved in cell wall biosynthesis